MGTQVEELYLKNKNRAKRAPSSGAFSLQVELPGGNKLEDGSHTLGKIEGNVCITRVSLLVKDGFDGTTPTITINDNIGNTYFTAEGISVPVVVESALTANDLIRPNPVYSDGVVEFTGAIVGGSDVGELMVVVDYTQLDTVTGTHTK